MRNIMCKTILAAIAVGLLSASYVSADTVDQAVSMHNSEVLSNSKNATPKIRECFCNYTNTKIAISRLAYYDSRRCS